MDKIICTTAAALCISLCHAASSATWYVDCSVSESGDGTSWETALKTIQQGIKAASDDDTVIVAEGTYLENINFNGKNIILRSTDPLRSGVVHSTVITGNESGSLVTFSGTENETCVLSGLTIMDGIAGYGGAICGGPPDNHTHATIENNLIGRNTAEYGGGLAYCDGAIRNNTIIVNAAHLNGGALYDCDGRIQSNTITWNSANCGGGLYGGDGIIQDNEVLYNSALDGGGMAHCQGTILNNGVAYNSADYAGGGLYMSHGAVLHNSFGWNVALDGGALSYCDGTIEDNGIHGNRAEYGGGLYSCNGTIQNNVIGSHLSSEGDETRHIEVYGNEAQHGGALAACSGTIRNNTITMNKACYGGGLSACDATVENNVISQNSAECNGGGLYECNGTIQNNLITGNLTQTDGDGGGLYRCDGLVRNNTIAGNQAFWGAGLACCRGTVLSNKIAGNSALVEGGGLYRCAAAIQNNTIVGNSADRSGGGIAQCSGTITNCILWGNAADVDAQLRDSGQPTYSCIQGWSDDRDGNISDAPSFVDAAGGDGDPETYQDNDYRLSPDSPCIDAGDNSLLDPPGLDLDGNLRIAFGRTSLTVDMGAYEYNSRPFAVTQVIANEGAGLQLIWNSQPSDSYTIWSCVRLSAATWVEEATLPSEGAITWWTDTAPTTPVKFYRIEMQ